MKFNESWQEWIDENVAKQCDNKALLTVLVNNGFDARESTLRLELAEIESKRKLAETNMMYAGSVGELFIPTALDFGSDKAEIYGIDAFLNDQECFELVDLVRGNLRNSSTGGESEEVSDYRTSKTCDLSLLGSELVDQIDQRICNMMGIDAADSEPIQAQWYEVGEEYKAHVDYFEPDMLQYSKYGEEKGQRIWSFMIYLNCTAEGGQTHFPELGLTIEPNTGSAVVWNNVGKDGQLNRATLHQGMPVKRGYKAIITKWFRSKYNHAIFKKESSEYLKPLTRDGFIKMPIPESIYNPLKSFYMEHRQLTSCEEVPGFISGTSENANHPPSRVIKLTEDMRSDIHDKLLPLVEAWAGDYLEPTYIYGIRQYLRGSVLKVHRDRQETHIVGCILNIDQEVDEDWPLLMEDHHYRQHNIILKPGEMVFYESGRLSHGRPTPLCGDSFTNVFAHFKMR